MAVKNFLERLQSFSEKINEKVKNFVESHDSVIIADCLEELLYYEEEGFGNWTISEMVDFMYELLKHKREELKRENGNSA